MRNFLFIKKIVVSFLFNLIPSFYFYILFICSSGTKNTLCIPEIIL